MPPKRTPKLKKKEQKSLIDTRLLEISLKVDDYVYKAIPISSRSAAQFIKEVNGYKNKCFGDKRSLQVIEKLERFMKGIIDEQQQLRNAENKKDDSITNDTRSQRKIVVDKPTSNVVLTKDVENDLSWVENIRYVREISVEERIPVYYQDSFWESYTLPNDWNDEWFQ